MFTNFIFICPYLIEMYLVFIGFFLALSQLAISFINHQGNFWKRF
ncbi:hypothetical protein GCHA_1581 [Paraglaciecola chathamensis S18K6]|uniref:Uncharacterized protein n=1 Tax=Paraglaciecola chathamensis S18K6 TaxID=1127672 RepID=A0AAV3UX50_9ALTE|nr:hypothetical protein GCHA_1581 [Paraglaciecola chathamensis S18K6]